MTTVLVALRHSIVWLLFIALAMFGLVALERAGSPSSPAVSSPVFELSKSSNASGPKNGPPPACANSNGKAAQNNPNCPTSSTG